MDDDDLHFSWDPRKAAETLGRRGIAFETATYVFDDPHRLESDDRFAEGEYRMIVIGQVESFLLTVVYAEPEELHYRIISARLATALERRAYEDNLFHA